MYCFFNHVLGAIAPWSDQRDLTNPRADLAFVWEEVGMLLDGTTWWAGHQASQHLG